MYSISNGIIYAVYFSSIRYQVFIIQKYNFFKLIKLHNFPKVINKTIKSNCLSIFWDSDGTIYEWYNI